MTTIRVERLAIIAVVVWLAGPVTAQPTGPRTLENLLDPATEDRGQGRAPDRNPDRNPDRSQDPAPFGETRPAAAADPPRPAKRLPIPDQAAVDEALELIKQAYDEQFKAAASDPDTAIRTFRDAADKTADAGRKYALLLVAERIAIDAGETPQALSVVARRAASFEIDPLVARHELLIKMGRSEGTRSDARFFGHVVETAESAVAADNFDLADAAADLAFLSAKTIEKDEKAKAVESRRKREQPPAPVAAGLLTEATKLQKLVRERRHLASEYRAAYDRLAMTPGDAAAAETVGRYLCFVKHDWKTGLPTLAKGAHEGLRALAARETALRKELVPPAADLMKLANEWWKLGTEDTALAPAEAEAIKKHAGIMYGDIAATLKDPIDVALARKRAKETGVAEKPAPTPKPVGEPVKRTGSGTAATPRTLDDVFPAEGR